MKIFAAKLAVLAICSLFAAECLSAKLIVRWNRKKLNCQGGNGICSFKPQKPPKCKGFADAAIRLEDREVEVSAALVRNAVRFTTLSPVPKADGPFGIDQPLEMDACGAEELGFSQVVLKPGEYRLVPRDRAFEFIVPILSSKPLPRQAGPSKQ